MLKKIFNSKIRGRVRVQNWVKHKKKSYASYFNTLKTVPLMLRRSPERERHKLTINRDLQSQIVRNVFILLWINNISFHWILTYIHYSYPPIRWKISLCFLVIAFYKEEKYLFLHKKSLWKFWKKVSALVV